MRRARAGAAERARAGGGEEKGARGEKVRLTGRPYPTAKEEKKEKAPGELGRGCGWAGPAAVRVGWKTAQDRVNSLVQVLIFDT
jgi:hypothetical protein